MSRQNYLHFIKKKKKPKEEVGKSHWMMHSGEVKPNMVVPPMRREN
jgi:hypothetical protein